MQVLGNRIYPDLCPETIWDITSETEKGDIWIHTTKTFSKNLKN